MEQFNKMTAYVTLVLLCVVLMLAGTNKKQIIDQEAEIAELRQELSEKDEQLEKYRKAIYSLNMQRGRVLVELERARE